MLNIPEYKEYGGETKIALMDNSSLAFMHELSQRSYPSDGMNLTERFLIGGFTTCT